MKHSLERAIASWCAAGEARRKRAAEVVNLAPLYEAGEAGEAATARTWYGIGALMAGRRYSVLETVERALMPTALDVMAEAAGTGNAMMAAFARGLLAENAAGGGPGIDGLARTWLTAKPVNQSAAAMVAGAPLDPSDGVSEAETAGVFCALGSASITRAGVRAEFFRALTDKAPRVANPPDGLPALHSAVNPWVVSLNLRGADLTAEVLPPPRDGVVIGADGRRFRVADMAALAAAINAQAVAPRIDFDHRSERASPTFAGSTRAEGWLSNFRVNANGGLDANMELGPAAAAAIRSGEYRYLSPALALDKGGEIVGLSSVALVNDPNMKLRAPAA